MDKKKKVLIILLVFVLLLGGASVLYKQLGEKADTNQLASETDVASEEQDDKDKAENEKAMAPDMTDYDRNGKEVHLSDYIGKPIVLNFWASWCGPCQMVLPIIEELAGEVKDAKICKVNVDEQPELAKEYRVMSIPTLMVFRDGKPVKREVGAKSKAEILEMLK